MTLKKISIILFISAALVAIFSQTLPISEDIAEYRLPILIIFGVLIGILNIHEDQERMFLIASIAFIFITETFIGYFRDYVFLYQIGLMLRNCAFFIGPAALTVAIKIIIEFASEHQHTKEEKKHKSLLEAFNKSPIYSSWDFIVFFAVVLVLITFIPQLFFKLEKYQIIVDYIDIFVIIIFSLDLFILYEKSNSFKDFLKKNWLDILAVIPFNLLISSLYFVKLFKIARIIRLFEGLSKLQKVKHISKVSKLNRPVKFFSEHSGFNKFVDNKNTQVKKIKKTKNN